jgi:hypothetical protein
MQIEPTEFINTRTGDRTYGVRVYDDYFATYDNTWDSIPDDDMEILKTVLKMDGTEIQDMFNNVQENEKGIGIGDNWYDWDEIKDIIEGNI